MKMIDGKYFDLDQTERAYQLGGKKVTWMDYAYSEEEQKEHDEMWDIESYFADFDAWWDSLEDEQKMSIGKNVLGIV